jgi:hypothetical protein
MSAAALVVATLGAQQPPESESQRELVGSSQGPPRRAGARETARLRERIALATAIVNRLEPEAKAKGFGAGWRQATLEALLGTPLSRLQGVQPTSVEALATTLAAPADPTESHGVGDLVYKPITPCRYVDTRNVGGRINGLRGYDITNAGSVYGGAAACAPLTVFGVSAETSIAALAMNITIVAPLGAPGFLAVKPLPGDPPSSLVNWYEAGPSVQLANQGIVMTELVDLFEEFFIHTSDPVHVVVDLFGAFTPRPQTFDVVLRETDARCVSGANCTAHAPPCPTGFTPLSGSCRAIADNGDPIPLVEVYVPPPPAGSYSYNCIAHNSSPVSATIFVAGHCVRVH